MLRIALIAVLVLIVIGLPSADGSAPRHVKVPNLVGLTRTEAEARLLHAGFRYLLPAPRAARFEALPAGPARTEEAVAEGSAPDRSVVAQEPSFGGFGQAGDVIGFATRLPPKPGTGERFVSGGGFDRAVVWPDDRGLTLHFRTLARRCDALDHVDVALAPRYVALEPSVSSSIDSEWRCSHLSKRVVHLELPEPVRDRIVVDSLPVRPRRGLHRVVPARYLAAHGAPRARAVALDLAHSSDCGLLAGAKVRETRHSVTITVFQGDLSRSRYCLADLITDLTVVPLRHPLGSRRIVDGARPR